MKEDISAQKLFAKVKKRTASTKKIPILKNEKLIQHISQVKPLDYGLRKFLQKSWPASEKLAHSRSSKISVGGESNYR